MSEEKDNVELAHQTITLRRQQEAAHERQQREVFRLTTQKENASLARWGRFDESYRVDLKKPK